MPAAVWRGCSVANGCPSKPFNETAGAVRSGLLCFRSLHKLLTSIVVGPLALNASRTTYYPGRAGFNLANCRLPVENFQEADGVLDYPTVSTLLHTGVSQFLDFRNVQKHRHS